MSSGINFKPYDPVAQLIATGGGGGLPTTGGTLTGDLILQAPAKVVQCQPPVGPCDLVNKQYVDGVLSVPGSIPGSSIVNNSITTNQLASNAVQNTNINPGPNSTLKGTSGTGVVSDISLGPGLSMPANVLNIDPATLQKAGNAQFGVVEFDATGDLTETVANSGIANLKEPPPGVIATNAGFSATGDFVSAKAGSIIGAAVPNGTPFTYGNLIFQMDDVAPRGLKIKLASGPGGYIAGGAQPYWDDGTPTPFVTGRYIYRDLDTVTFKFLSERVNGEPVGSTLVVAPWDTTTATGASNTGQGYQEIYNFYVNDGVDDCGYRVTSMFFNPNSFIVVERLTG